MGFANTSIREFQWPFGLTVKENLKLEEVIKNLDQFTLFSCILGMSMRRALNQFLLFRNIDIFYNLKCLGLEKEDKR